LRIDAANRSLGWVAVAEAFAVPAAATYAVTPHAGLCVVDFDTPNVESAAAGFDHLCELASRCGLDPLVCSSGREGHRHCFIATGPLDESQRVALDRTLREVGLDVRRTAVRPPLSPHRESAASSTFTVDDTEALRSLAVVPDPAAVQLFLVGLGVPRAQRSPVSAKTATLLRRGHEGFYPSASEARMAVALSVRSAAGTVSLLSALLRDEAHPLGASFRSRTTSWQEAELARLWDKAGAFLSVQAKAAPSVRWHVAATRHPRTGKAGLSELAVVEVFAERGLRCHTDRIAFALDELAVTAGVARSTARAALRRLVDAGWLTVHAPPSATLATVWALTFPDGEDTSLPSGSLQSPAAFLAIPLGVDAGRHGSVGKAPLRVLRLVEAAGAAGVTAQDAACALGVTAQTVRRHLRVLASFSLVVQQNDPSPDQQRTRWERGEGSLQTAAEATGTAGASKRDREALDAKRQKRRKR
jgi:DNA-binding MarR family transcriptional regulator